MNILIFGGAGYIGTKLVKLLLANKFNVTVFDNLLFGGDHLLSFNDNYHFNFIKGDIRDEKIINQINSFQNSFHKNDFGLKNDSKLRNDSSKLSNVF